MATTHHLDRGTVHREWNNALPPRLTIDPGDTVVFDTRDAADGYYSTKSTHADVLARGPFRGHPLTGPVAVRDARPGDVLTVEIIDVKPAAEFGWTAIRPGRGLMPEAAVPDARADLLGARARAVLRHDRPRPRSLCRRPKRDPLHDRAPGGGARAQPRGGLHPLQRRRRPEDQRDRRRAELDRVGVSSRNRLRMSRDRTRLDH